MKRALAFAGGLGLVLTTSTASAAGPTREEIDQSLRSYYGGERASAYVVTGLGVVSTGAGAFLVTRDSDFARGMGWPLLGLGALETIGGIFYAFQVGAEIDHYEEVLGRDPAAFKKEELAHVEGTASRFVYYRLAELALTLAGAGIATYGFAADKDVYKGVGVGLASVGLPFLVIDTINNGRAESYADDLRRFEPAVAPGPGGSFGFSLRGTF